MTDTNSTSLEFEGFANTTDEDGNRVDAREVDPFVDESEEGQLRDASQKTESSLVQFRTEGPSTNGAPAATVGKSSTETATGSTAEASSDADAEDAEPDSEPEIEQRNDAPEDLSEDHDPQVADEDEVEAGGQGANEA